MEENSTAVVTQNDLMESVTAANAGDERALAVLRKQLKSKSAKSFVNYTWDMARQLEMSLLKSMFGDQLGSREMVMQHLHEMREELGWETSPRMEQILIDRVVLTWLYVHMLELQLAQTENLSNSRIKLFELRIEKGQRRHLKAIKMLATVRKMALPMLVDVRAQINVVDNRQAQVKNVAINSAK